MNHELSEWIAWAARFWCFLILAQRFPTRCASNASWMDFMATRLIRLKPTFCSSSRTRGSLLCLSWEPGIYRRVIRKVQKKLILFLLLFVTCVESLATKLLIVIWELILRTMEIFVQWKSPPCYLRTVDVEILCNVLRV